jgi:hypothetical protein
VGRQTRIQTVKKDRWMDEQIGRQTHRCIGEQTGKQTDSHKVRWIDVQLGRQTVKQTHRCMGGQTDNQIDSNKFKCMDEQIGIQTVRQTHRCIDGQTGKLHKDRRADEQIGRQTVDTQMYVWTDRQADRHGHTDVCVDRHSRRQMDG